MSGTLLLLRSESWRLSDIVDHWGARGGHIIPLHGLCLALGVMVLLLGGLWLWRTIEHQRFDLPVLLVFYRVARSMSLSLAEQWVLVRITWHESLPSPLTLMCSPATFNFHADRYAQSVSKRTAIHDARHLVSLRIKLFN